MLLQERDGAILTITLNMPEKRNPISDVAVVDALCAAFDEADRDISVRCVILTGAGTAFSAGGDLKQMRPDSGGLRSSNPVETRRNYKYGIQRLPLMFQALEVPVVAAVNGQAIGAGLDLATMCDIRVASESARFAESFVKLGIIPGDGGAWLLPRIVGFSRATELALTGETIDAAEALKIGLVSHVVPDADLLAKAKEKTPNSANELAFMERFLLLDFFPNDMRFMIGQDLMREGNQSLKSLWQHPELGQVFLENLL